MIAALGVIFLLNYADFVNYYWFAYPKYIQSDFGQLGQYRAYEQLENEAKNRDLVPYIENDLYQGDGQSGKFFESIYFKAPLLRLGSDDELPAGAILLTHRQEIPGARVLETPFPDYRLLIKE